MTNIYILACSILIAETFGDWYHDTRQGWKDWKREAWKLDQPNTRREQ